MITLAHFDLKIWYEKSENRFKINEAQILSINAWFFSQQTKSSFFSLHFYFFIFQLFTNFSSLLLLQIFLGYFLTFFQGEFTKNVHHTHTIIKFEERTSKISSQQFSIPVVWVCPPAISKEWKTRLNKTFTR